MKAMRGILAIPDTIFDEETGEPISVSVVEIIDVQVTHGSISGTDLHVLYLLPNGEIRKTHTSRIKVMNDESEREGNPQGVALPD